MNRSIVYSFKNKYAKLNLTAKNKLKEEVTQIKERSLKELDLLIPRTIKKLEENGIKVYIVKSHEEAGKKLANLIANEKLVVKSKSNAINQIDLKKHLPKTKVVETDLGDFLAQTLAKHDKHPVLPALSFTCEEIATTLNSKFKVKLQPDANVIANWVREHLRDLIKSAKLGLSGANIITCEGEIFLLENEGNISLVSRLPEKHIVVSGVEKIVKHSDEALKVSQAMAQWGTGQSRGTYTSIITGPSKTADIENKLIIGAQGTKEVHLILIDDRETYEKMGLEDILKCINCGACLSLCPAYHTSELTDQYEGIKALAVRYIKGENLTDTTFACTTCGMCNTICPVGINLREILLTLRSHSEQPSNNKRMFDYVEKFGNPFGDTPEAIEELYCC